MPDSFFIIVRIYRGLFFSYLSFCISEFQDGDYYPHFGIYLIFFLILDLYGFSQNKISKQMSAEKNNEENTQYYICKS